MQKLFVTAATQKYPNLENRERKKATNQDRLNCDSDLNEKAPQQRAEPSEAEG